MPPTSPLSNPEHLANESHLVTGTDCVAIEMREKLGRLPSTMQKFPCIYGGHGRVWRQQVDDSKPRVIAIGPYHHGNPKLQKMEDRKLCYLQQFFKRRNAMSLDDCLSAIRQMEDEAHQCYEEPINLDADKFAEMLLLDSCFIIEYVTNCFESTESLDESLQLKNDINHDLILMDNQLPFFVLRKLSPDRDILTLALRFVERYLVLETFQEISIDDIDHLLGLLHYRLSSIFSETSSRETQESKEGLSWDVINSATELQEAGVQFKKIRTVNLCDIKFEKGLLEIPQLRVDLRAVYVYKNLIAYEQCDPEYRHGNLISDYIRFIDCLINSSRDVEFLRQQGIIQNWAGDDENVFFLINTLSNKLITSPNFSYTQVFNKLNQHCRKRRHMWMATLRHNYFNSPWALVSFVAAVVLLGLTIAQTVFSALSYARKD